MNRDADFIMARINALAIACPYCRAPADEPCADPISGYVLEHQPAHSVRLREANVL